MEYKVKAYNIWEVGQKFDANGMPHQEDALFPAYGACTADDRVFVLCDGMGGHDNGEIASAVVCSAISQSVLRRLGAVSGTFRESIFDKALADAYNALDANDTGAPRKMGTTMAFLCLYDKGCFMAHIGDTRIYHIRPGDDAGSTQILFSTTDHSLVNRLVASGKMSLEEAIASTRRHVITRAMQPHMEKRPMADVDMSADIRDGDYFVMLTHGMLDNLSESTLKKIFSRQGGNDGNKFRLLREATANNRDNHSAVVIHIEAVIRSRVTRKTPVDTADTPGRTMSSDEDNMISRLRHKVHDTTQRTDGPADGGSNTARILSRFLMGLMMLLSVIMVIYYAFIRNDEAMLEAGRSTETFSTYDPYKPDEEKYGYETKSTEIIDDRVMDDGSADTISVTSAEDIIADEPQPDVTEPAQTPEPTPEPAPEPAPEPDMPILQE